VVSKILGTTVIISAGAVGGVVGYSAVDQDFRKMVEETIPGSNELMELVLGGKEIIPPPKPVPSKLKISSPVVITIPKVVEEKPAVLDPQESSVAGPALKVPSPPLEKPESSASELPLVVEVPAPPMEVPVAPMEEPLKASLGVSNPEVSALAVEVTPVVEVPAVVNVTPAVEVPPVVEELEVPPPAAKEAIIVEESKIIEIAPVEVIPEVATQKEDESEVVKDVSTKDENVHVTQSAEIESVPDVENTSLEEMLVELCKEMQDMVSTAVTGYETSSAAVVAHISLMQKVLESNLTVKDDSAWNEMFSAAQDKSEKAKAAEMKEKEAMLAITNVLESISAGRKNKVTSTNPNLVMAEEKANKAIYHLDQAKARRAAVQSEASVMEEYKDLVEAGREQFHKEMASIMPDVKLGEKNGKLTEEELNMFITHAYKKVLFLQQEVAKQQTLEQERFKKALDKQRMEIETLATKHVEGELERQAREMQVEHERRMAAIKEDAEGELRAQLRRQAAAHTDHLTDVLSVQEAELTRHHEHQMTEEMASLKSTQVASMSSLSGTVTGLSEAIQARAASDSASLTSQALWLACNTLNTTLTRGRVDATTWEEKLNPLVKEVGQVKVVAGDDDKFVEVVLASISPVALERGVYTEDSLKERFSVVEKTARKVAGIGEEGGSLLAFGLSYLQSLLMVDLVQREPAENMGVVDLSVVSPMDLVSMAKHSLDQGNLARAVQLMTQLKGESGRVVSDWVAEARLTLETKQAVQAIMVHSLANSCKYMPGV